MLDQTFGFFLKIFFEIFSENPILMKWIIVAMIAAVIRSPEKCHPRKSAIRDGTVIITAIMELFINTLLDENFAGLLLLSTKFVWDLVIKIKYTLYLVI